MADRHTLSASHIDEFKLWLIDDGFTLQEPKGLYEAIRATKPSRKHPFIAYKRYGVEDGEIRDHFTVADKDMGVVRAFLRDQRKRKHLPSPQETEPKQRDAAGETELKPCPFCGGKARMQFDYEGELFNGKWDFAYYAHCTKCHATTSVRNRLEAASELWNTRAEGVSQTSGRKE